MRYVMGGETLTFSKAAKKCAEKKGGSLLGSFQASYFKISVAGHYISVLKMRDVIRVLCFNGLIPYTWSQDRSRSSTMLRRTKGCAAARTAAAAKTRRKCTAF